MKTYKVLLVDDDPAILEALSSALEGEGYDVRTADNGRSALELIANSTFDIVVTDLVMDDIDGIAVLKSTKAKNPDSIVMILTGYGDMNSAIDALRLNADDYILKPCSDDEFFFRIKRGIEKLEYMRKVKIYEHILPVCCVCKKIRDDIRGAPGAGEWMPVEEYLTKKAKISVTSSYCPECAAEVRKEMK